MNKTNIKDLDFNIGKLKIIEIGPEGHNAKCIFSRKGKTYMIYRPKNWETDIQVGDNIRVVKCKTIKKKSHLEKTFYGYSLLQIKRDITNDYFEYIINTFEIVSNKYNVVASVSEKYINCTHIRLEKL